MWVRAYTEQTGVADSSSGDGAEESREELNQRLHDAALAGDVVKLREAIAAGADVDRSMPFESQYGNGYKGRTPLCAVVSAMEVRENRTEKGRTACVRALLDAGASASAAIVLDSDEEPVCTALHHAAFSGLGTISRLLLDAGADLNARTQGDCTPLRYAVVHKHHRVVVLLLSRGATTDGETENFERYHSPGYLARIERAGSFANYQKQQRAKLMAMLAPKMDHLLPPELVSHVITFWGHLGWN